GGTGQYVPGAAPCVFDQAAFKRLVNQYASAIAPMAMYPARTTGYGGFQFTLEAGFTNIDSSADYWQRGTRGPRDPNTGRYGTRNASPDDWLVLYNAHLRKGLPLGFEVGADVGYLSHTSIFTGGVDLRFSLFEGFRAGFLGVFPDISLGAAVRTITGTPQFSLTVVSGEGMVSKPIPIADSSILTPYVGYQFMRIFVDSGAIDATPDTDALGYCNYQGQSSTGQPVCGTASSGGSPDDLNNIGVFDNTRISRHRIVFGLSYRYEILVLGAEFITDIVAPADANNGAEAQALRGTPRQSTLAVQLGVAF
ncbi:MAG TPA: hypothetical protein VGL13_17155, partial [Polyangiaceae bacterium]